MDRTGPTPSSPSPSQSTPSLRRSPSSWFSSLSLSPSSSSSSPSPAPTPPTSPYAPQQTYQPRPSIFAPIILIPMSITPSPLADQAAAFNSFFPLTSPPPKYNDRFRRPSKRNLRQALERLETTYGPWESHLPSAPGSEAPSTVTSPLASSASLLSPSSASTSSSSSSYFPAPPSVPAQLPSYDHAYLHPPSYPQPEPEEPTERTSLVPGWDKHPVLPVTETPALPKRPRRTLLDIFMPGLGRRRIFGENEESGGRERGLAGLGAMRMRRSGRQGMPVLPGAGA